MSFAALKNSSSSMLDRLNKELDKMNSNEGSGDDRLWKPQVDKSGNGYAVIRFLPNKNLETNPYVQIWSHAFQGPGGWYIENSLTTMNQKDPVGEMNRQLWNSGLDSDKEIARKQKRKLSYYSNIYVVSDPANPDNEGKVFLYKYGKKIWDKIVEAMQPAFADETAINPFDPYTGADFKLKIRKVDGYWNYDKSEFASPSALLTGEDKKLDAVANNLFELTELVDTNNFKSYDELKNRLNIVLGTSTQKVTARKPDAETFEDEEEFTYNQPVVSESSTQEDEDVDDALSYFARLAQED